MNNKGVSLIALIVTIIVMVVIAGITMLAGFDNITKTQKTAFMADLEVLTADLQTYNTRAVLMNNLDYDYNEKDLYWDGEGDHFKGSAQMEEKGRDDTIKYVFGDHITNNVRGKIKVEDGRLFVKEEFKDEFEWASEYYAYMNRDISVASDDDVIDKIVDDSLILKDLSDKDAKELKDKIDIQIKDLTDAQKEKLIQKVDEKKDLTVLEKAKISDSLQDIIKTQELKKKAEFNPNEFKSINQDVLSSDTTKESKEKQIDNTLTEKEKVTDNTLTEKAKETKSDDSAEKASVPYEAEKAKITDFPLEAISEYKLEQKAKEVAEDEADEVAEEEKAFEDVEEKSMDEDALEMYEVKQEMKAYDYYDVKK